ncbi:MAG: SIS domain-containing protein [Thermoguttaceae bacterium]|nr:SIS domain-containing protein [Thermoguttaceae bacterium]
MLGITHDAESYLVKLGEILRSLNFQDVHRLSEIIYHSYSQGRTVFVFGNGGSALTASHFAEDLAKGTLSNEDLWQQRRPRLKVVSLADNVGWITALANDLAYEEIFLQQLVNLAEPGDLAVAISGSGNSPNVIKAVEWANANGLITFGLTGFDGGRLKKIQQMGLHVPLADMGMVEAIHSCVLHWVVDDLFARIHRQGRYGSLA